MPETLNDYQNQIQAWKGQCVDIIYHPHASYRMLKEGNAIIRNVYDNFFEVEIFTKLYGSYKTTISYVDLYTGTCKISLHEETKKVA